MNETNKPAAQPQHRTIYCHYCDEWYAGSHECAASSEPRVERNDIHENPTDDCLPHEIASSEPQEWTVMTINGYCSMFLGQRQITEAYPVEEFSILFGTIADESNAAVKAAYEKGKQDGVREHYVGK